MTGTAVPRTQVRQMSDVRRQTSDVRRQTSEIEGWCCHDERTLRLEVLYRGRGVDSLACLLGGGQRFLVAVVVALVVDPSGVYIKRAVPIICAPVCSAAWSSDRAHQNSLVQTTWRRNDRTAVCSSLL